MKHYTTCGLPDVWLANGYRVRNTPHGEATAIEDLEGLHRAIAHHLVANRPALSGGELRFLRKELELSQAALAALLGNDVQSVALWEKRGRLPKWADRFVRALYREYANGNAGIVELVERLNRLEQGERGGRLVFEETAEGWRAAA